MREETTERYSSDDFENQRARELDALSGKSGDSREKALQKLLASWSTELAAKAKSHDMDVVYWEDLGIDCLMADEAHAYKNLHKIRVQGFGGATQPKFLGGAAESAQAYKMQMMSRFVREQSPDNGIFFLTATPTKNSPLEVYNMLQHMAHGEFERLGIRNVNDFVDRFCRIESRTYLDPKTSEIVTGPCVVGFSNLSELQGILDRYMMVRTAGDVGLKIPDAPKNLEIIEMSDEQLDVYSDLQEELANINAREDPGGVWRVSAKMTAAAQDLELYDPERFNGWHKKSPKYRAVVDKVMEGVRERGGQIVFCDRNEPHGHLRDMLIEAGLTASEIGILNAEEAPDSAARQRIGALFNRGLIKVVIGNTGVMGEGVNLQGKKTPRGTTDIHHLDTPWDPGTVHQRNGRGVRQGNPAEQTSLHHYVTRGTYDAYRFEVMKGKEVWLQQLLRAVRSGVDSVDAVMAGEDDATERQILLSPNPEEARAEYDAAKAEALAKWFVARAEKDIMEWAKLQKMYKQLQKIAEDQREGLEASIARTERKLQRSESCPAAIKEYIGDRDAPAAMAVTHLEGEGEDARVAATIYRVGDVVSDPDGNSRRVITSVDARSRKLRLRRYGSDVETLYEKTTPDETAKRLHAAAKEAQRRLTKEERQTAKQHMLHTAIEELRGLAVTGTVGDELAESIAATPSYSHALSGLGYFSDDLLEANRPAIEERVRRWGASNGRRYGRLLVQTANGVEVVPARDVVSRSAQLAIQEAIIKEAEEYMATSSYSGSYYTGKIADAKRAIKAIQAGAEAPHASSRIVLPFGRDAEIYTQTILAMAPAEDRWNGWENPALGTLRHLLTDQDAAGARHRAIEADARRRWKATRKAAA